MAQFLVDESLPERVRDQLNAIGHEAVHIFDLGLAGASDDVIFDRAKAEGRIIITLDLGFGDIAFGESVGLVIVRNRKRIEIDELVACDGDGQAIRGRIRRLRRKDPRTRARAQPSSAKRL
jgi:predicted nuclease of predicted toxin-antitoxin system